ncbi:DHA2 family efflux MFS transporter permease subunit [Ferruginibacter sp. HRS2-29]|uniref:DHA2 family efflux MFS transporter permease subunit n=1 Tax=Ferruginibacter sp. HRS2-29 TaxID=2487334 RepID=UPI0020CDB132|nr:DHA2 family efflux MFS transporter permease subunit [Ferruginibacter sp. HRS2-29]
MKKNTWILITLMLGTMMAALDSSIVNVSLPVIRNEFRESLSNIEWVVTAYMICFCLFIPLTNWLKLRIGYYNLFLFSVIMFTSGSLLCSLSQSLPMLVTARVIQATGGALISPVSLAILSENYPPEKRGSAIGWWGIGNVMGPALGPTLGGLLTNLLGWQSIFYINIPLGILTIFLTIRHLGFLKAQPVSNTKFDLAGYFFFAVFILSLQYMVTAISSFGISWQLAAGVAGTGIFLFLFLRSSTRTFPLLDLTVFKSRVFRKSAIIVVIRSLALYGGLFFLPFLLQGVMGFTSLESGLILLPNALMMLFTRPLAGKLADKGMVRNVSITGIIIVAASFVLFAFVEKGVPLWFIILPMVIRGLGMSLLVAPVSTALLNSVTAAQTSTSTAINSLLQQIGGSIGIALSGVIHTFINDHYISKQHTAEVAEHFALQDGFFISAFIIALAIIPALGLPEKQAVKNAVRTSVAN